MSPEAPSSTPAEVPPTPSETGGEAQAPVLPEAPVVPETTGDTTPPPVAEEAQAADRMIGPPPEGTPIPQGSTGISFSDGPVPHNPGRPVITLENGPGVVALPGGVVTAAPRGPEFSVPVSNETPEAPVSAPTEAAPEAPAPADAAPVTEPSTPESQA